jgi:hypothetical protein
VRSPLAWERDVSTVGIPTGDLLSRMLADERRIERAGVNVSSYTAPGCDNTVLTGGPFYDETVGGKRLVDVRCVRCRG